MNKMTGKIKTDFITSGLMIEEGDHIYLRFTNEHTQRNYIFHIAKELFLAILENKQKTTGNYILKDNSVNKKRNGMCI